MSAKEIRALIESFPKERRFTWLALRHLGTQANCEIVLSRLVKEGQLNRINAGIYSKGRSCMTVEGCGRADCPQSLDCGVEFSKAVIQAEDLRR